MTKKSARYSQLSNRKGIIRELAYIRSDRARGGFPARNLGRIIGLSVPERGNLLSLNDTDVHNAPVSVNHVDNVTSRVMADPDPACMVGLWFFLRLNFATGDVPHL